MPSVLDLLGPQGRIAGIIGAAYEARQPQLTMAAAVQHAVLTHTSLVVEAGTGIGKSLAYLVGGAAAGVRSIVSTSSKALQGQLLTKDLPLLARALGGLTYGVAKGKSNYLCLWKARGRTDRYADWLWPAGVDVRAITAWADTTASGDLDTVPTALPGAAWEQLAAGDDCLGKHCQMYDQCWYYRSKQGWQEADVVLTNHALLLTDLTTPVGLPASDGRRPLLLVCDEAHQLESYAVAAKSADITLRALRWADDFGAELADLSAEFMQAVADRFARPNSDVVIPAETELDQGLDLVQALCETASEHYRGSQPPTEAALMDDYVIATRLRGLADRVSALIQPTAAGYVRHVQHVNGRRGDLAETITISNTAWRVADLLAQLKMRAATTVYCSATLATGKGASAFNYFKRGVGLNWEERQPAELLVDTPFDYSRQGLLYLPPAGRLPADPNAPAYSPAAAQEIARLVRLAGNGQTLCLFASYSALRQVADLLPRLAPGVTVLAQGADLSRDAILQQFRAVQGRGLVILGAKSFWEGVSLEGDQLRLVIVERVMFTPPGPVQLAKQADLEAHGGNWFRDLALPEAIATLRQGVGRLIRTTTDRGVVALLDPRLNTRPWGKQVLSALPPFSRTADIQAVHTFLTR